MLGASGRFLCLACASQCQTAAEFLAALGAIK
jgi:hypothetical protein